jgi:hypothetical protein
MNPGQPIEDGGQVQSVAGYVNGNGIAEPESAKYPRLLTRHETASMLRCCLHTVRKLELQGLLHPVHYNRRKFYRPDEVLDVIEG